MILNVDNYDQLETNALKELPNRVVQAFAPIYFQRTGYPIRVSSERELVKFADALHELNYDRYYSRSFLLSMDEAELIASISDKIFKLTQQQYGCGLRPHLGPLAALDIFRAVSQIDTLAEGGRPVSVFEVGAGNGLLGAFLIESGHRYLSTDVAQAFYLWQSHLFEYLSKDDFVELAGDHSKKLPNVDKKVVHLPWFIYGMIHEHADYLCNVDVVVCEAALGEIPGIALAYILRVSRMMLDKSEVGLFVFSHIGELGVSGYDHVFDVFKRTGFIRCDAPNGIFCFATPYSKITGFEYKEGAFHFDRTGRPKRIASHELIDNNKGPIAADYRFFEFVGMKNPFPRLEQRFIERLDRYVAEWQKAKKRIVIYGAGDHTSLLLRDTLLGQAFIVGMADKDPTLHGTRLWGYNIVAPGEIGNLQPDVIFVSSGAFYKEIVQSLSCFEADGITLVTIYD